MKRCSTKWPIFSSRAVVQERRTNSCRSRSPNMLATCAVERCSAPSLGAARPDRAGWHEQPPAGGLLARPGGVSRAHRPINHKLCDLLGNIHPVAVNRKGRRCVRELDEFGPPLPSSSSPYDRSDADSVRRLMSLVLPQYLERQATYARDKASQRTHLSPPRCELIWAGPAGPALFFRPLLRGSVNRPSGAVMRCAEGGFGCFPRRRC